VEIRKDPRVPASLDELNEQFAFLLQIRDTISGIHRVVNAARGLRQQLAARLAHLDRDAPDADVAQSLRRLDDQLAALVDALVQDRVRVGSDFAVYPPKINSKLLALASVVDNADAAPTTQAYAVFADLAARAEPALQQFQTLLREDLPALEEQLRGAGMPYIWAGTASDA